VREWQALRSSQRFVVLLKRSIIERTFAWIGRCGRLVKGTGMSLRKALAFLKLPFASCCEKHSTKMILLDGLLGM
jgi:transposase